MTASTAARCSGWTALVATMLARMLLGVLASLLLWSVAPIALGWHPTVVMTGSMLPRLVPGDVVLSRPVPVEKLQVDQILLYDDPDRAHHLRLHRFVRTTADGRLVTRGDANPADDSTPVATTAVHGVGSLRVPFVARPVVWAQSGDVVALGGTTLSLIAVLVLATWFRPADTSDQTSDQTSDETSDLSAQTDQTSDQTDLTDVPPAHDTPPADDAATAPGRGRLPIGASRLARVTVTVTALVVAGVVFAVSANAAPFGRTSVATPASFTAATYYGCSNAVNGADARFSWPLGESSGSTARDVTANATDGTYSGSIGYGTAGPCRYDRSTAITLSGSGSVSTTSTAANIPAMSLQIWFRTTSAGTLMSVTATTGFIFTTDTTSIALAVTTAGRLTFGVSANGAKTVTSTAAVADGGWHLAVGTVGPAGLALYVDALAPVTSTAATTATGVSGTPRVGYGDASDLGTGTVDSFTGSLAYATFYKSALTAAQVSEQFLAATAA